MEAQLSRRGRYQEAITYPLKDAKRNELLDKAIAAFKDLYDKYRGWSGGFYAQMWQGKCLEEKDELGAAMGIYDQLLEHKDPRLRGIQRQVDYFRIIVYGKRKQFVLASDECLGWIQANPARSGAPYGPGSAVGNGQEPLRATDDAGEGEKGALERKAMERLTEVAHAEPGQAAGAIELLRKLEPKAAINANSIAVPTVNQALTEAQDSLETKDYARDRRLQNRGTKISPLKDIDKLDDRYLWIQAAFFGKRYYDAAVLA